MGTLSDTIKGIGNKQKKSSKKPDWADKDWHWERTNLEDVGKTIKKNIKWGEEKSKTGWTNPKTGDTFSKEHYKEGVAKDKLALDRVQKEIKNRKLIKGLKEREKKISNDAKYKRRDRIDDWIEQ